MEMKYVRQLTGVGLAAAALTAVSAGPALASGTELGAKLAPGKAFPAAKGYADYQRGQYRELDVKVSHLAGMAGQRLGVFLNGHRVGSMVVRASGRAEFDVTTEYGQKVPRVHLGDRLGVRSHGMRVAGGKFRPLRGPGRHRGCGGAEADDGVDPTT
jgi:hypothetical protein